MTLEEIKSAVNAGKTVHWSHDGYHVICDALGQWFIRCAANDNMIGLTWQDNVTMNGKPKDFFIALPTPGDLAAAFRTIIRSWLGESELDDIDRSNRSPEYMQHNLCASHDFCDPNQAMIDALQTLGIELDTQDERQRVLIDHAWSLAKTQGFSDASACGV